MSISKEDYLGEIYRLQFSNNRAAKLTEIAKAMKISKPSASQMIRKLAKEKLVVFERYSGITLTKNGIEEARAIIRRHQLLEVFFNDVLKIKGKFHSEAHKVEHSLSDEVVDKLDKMLKRPIICPDGNPIPLKNNKVVELSELPEKSDAEVLFSTTKDKSCIDLLNSLGLVPQARIRILRKLGNGPLIILVKDSEVALGPDICSKIFVEKK